jgi:hypothetical protein
MNMSVGWDAVTEATKTTKAIAWDGCHKIYLAMDDEQVREFTSLGYGVDDDDSVLIMAGPASPGELLTYLRNWYEVSCFLKFISAVRTNTADPNAGFTDLIPQGWEEEE